MTRHRCVAYRNTAMPRLGQLLKELGPVPKGRAIPPRREKATNDPSPYTAEDSPIAAAMLPFGNTDSRGARSTTPSLRNRPSTSAGAAHRLHRSRSHRTWVRVGDLSPERLADFKGVLSDVGLTIPAISTSRRSVMDPEHGEEYLAYSHRLLDVAAELGVSMVSFGLLPGVHARAGASPLVLAGRGLARRRVAGGATSSRFAHP